MLHDSRRWNPQLTVLQSPTGGLCPPILIANPAYPVAASCPQQGAGGVPRGVCCPQGGGLLEREDPEAGSGGGKVLAKAILSKCLHSSPGKRKTGTHLWQGLCNSIPQMCPDITRPLQRIGCSVPLQRGSPLRAEGRDSSGPWFCLLGPQTWRSCDTPRQSH